MNTLVLDEKGIILAIYKTELNPLLIADELRENIQLVETITNEAVGKYKNSEGDYVYPESPVISEDESSNPDRFISVMEFKLRMTSLERVAIKELAQSDPIVEDFMEIIDDTRLTEINLSSDTISQSLKYLISKDILTEERVQEIVS